MNQMEALRAKLLAANTKGDKTTSRSSGGDNASFPFWDTPVNQSSTLRFLPDHPDANNGFFWVERQSIKIPFSGVDGGDFPTERDVVVTVPCNDMFEKNTCPIIAATKHMWDDPAKVDTARIYYKKRSFIFQGFVVNTPIQEQTAPENPIRRFVIGKQIYDIVYNALIDPEMEVMPCDYDQGRDFRVSVTQKGKWNDYVSSKFTMSTRSLDEAQRAAIDTYGLFNLKDSLGAPPTKDHLAAQKAMLEDSLAGRPFDMTSYGQYYRPYGVERSSNPPVIPSAAAETRAPSPSVSEPSASPDQNANDAAKVILDRLRAKKMA